MMIENLTNVIIQYLSSENFSLMFLIVSFIGGIISSISPCSIGMLPLIIGYVGGYGDTNKKKTAIQLLSFVFGLAVILSIIGSICALGGSVFTALGGAYWILFLSSFILVLGLNLLGVIEFNLSPIIKKIPKGNSASLFIYPFVVGILFAFATSPCSTPILAGIMSFAALSKNITIAILMLLCFSLGQGIIVILAGLFTSFLKGVKSIVNISEILMKISGWFLIIGSILIYIKVFSKFF